MDQTILEAYNKQLASFLDDAFEYIIPVSMEKQIIEMDKEYACMNLTVQAPVKGKDIAKVLESYKINYNKEKVLSNDFLDVFIAKGSNVHDFLDITEIYTIVHDNKKTFIII